MPNWCFNYMKVNFMDEWRLNNKNKDEMTKQEKRALAARITESKKQLEDFEKNSLVEKDGELQFTFEGVLPMPEDLKITSPPQNDTEKAQSEINLKKYGAKDWYDWSINNWGTKWDARLTGHDKCEHEGTLMLNFETAWAPPEHWLEAATKKYPLLDFEIHIEEESDAFYGRIKAAFGKVWDGTVSNQYIEESREA